MSTKLTGLICRSGLRFWKPSNRLRINFILHPSGDAIRAESQVALLCTKQRAMAFVSACSLDYGSLSSSPNSHNWNVTELERFGLPAINRPIVRVFGRFGTGESAAAGETSVE